MALPIEGAWKRANQVPYSGAAVWGTGIHPVHELYGSDPLREMDPRGAPYDRQKPADSRVDPTSDYELWGYTCEEGAFVGYIGDGRPGWNEVTPQIRGDANNYPPINASGMRKSDFREAEGGARRDQGPVEVDSWPQETVTEGWRNKPKGNPADSKPSDSAQYERQTSMQQRYRTRNNRHAVTRGTDEPRAGIESRVVGQKLKIYSGGERHYDMEPKEQEVMLRPFWYRTAGTGDPRWMLANTLTRVSPIRRTPPPDPFIGNAEERSGDYGYTAEDQFYA